MNIYYCRANNNKTLLSAPRKLVLRHNNVGSVFSYYGNMMANIYNC